MTHPNVQGLAPKVSCLLLYVHRGFSRSLSNGGPPHHCAQLLAVAASGASTPSPVRVPSFSQVLSSGSAATVPFGLTRHRPEGCGRADPTEGHSLYSVPDIPSPTPPPPGPAGHVALPAARSTSAFPLPPPVLPGTLPSNAPRPQTPQKQVGSGQHPACGARCLRKPGRPGVCASLFQPSWPLPPRS